MECVLLEVSCTPFMGSILSVRFGLGLGRIQFFTFAFLQYVILLPIVIHELAHDSLVHI